MTTLQVPALDLSYPTLGPAICDFIEENWVFGPGSLRDEPARLDAEKRAMIYRFYEIMPRGHRFAGQRRFHRCGYECRKGLAKTELGAWVTGTELHPDAPVRFDGWDANGNPVGRPVNSPYIPMMAFSEEQVEELAYGVLRYIVQHAQNDMSGVFDVGLERIVRLDQWGREDGMALPVSNAPGARDGARTTFQYFDEPHRLFLARHVAAHETMTQNLDKRQLEDPWSLYTSTAGQPGQRSVQELVREEAEKIADGRMKNPRLFFFSRWAGPEHDDLTSVELRTAAIADATGPVGEWGAGQFERIAEGYDRPGVDRAYWERVWLNRWRKSGSQAFDMVRIKNDLLTEEMIPKGAFCTAGFDGARFRDSTAIVLTDIATGRQQCMALWERPIDWPDEMQWEVNELEVFTTWEYLMETYEIYRAYCDPPYWVESVASWSSIWPEVFVEFWTNRPKAMAYVVRSYQEAHDAALVDYALNDFGPDLIRHLGNSGKKELNIRDDEGKPLYVIQKMDGRPEDRIDAAMAGMLSWEACVDARREGATPRPKAIIPRRLY